MFGYFKNKWNERKLEIQRREEEVDRAIWNAHYPSGTFNDLSLMTGRQFEEFLSRLLDRMGYTDIRMTPANDQGGDITCISPRGIQTVVQAKRWNGPVGNGSVQEVLGAMRHYGCDEGIVITNSRFTPAAKSLVANGSDVTLCDKQWLEDKMHEFLPTSVPEFRRDLFDEMIEGWRLMTRRAAAEATTRRKRLPRGHSTLTELLRCAAEAKGKELTVKEIKRFAHLHVDLSEAEANTRMLDRKMEQTRARIQQLEAEAAAIDDELSMADAPSWRDEYKER